MSIWIEVARIATGVNVFLLLLGFVQSRNHTAFRSKHTLGLLVFSLFLLAENGSALYYYLVDPTLSVWFTTSVRLVVWRTMLSLNVLETVGLAFLAWASWD